MDIDMESHAFLRTKNHMVRQIENVAQCGYANQFLVHITYIVNNSIVRQNVCNSIKLLVLYSYLSTIK